MLGSLYGDLPDAKGITAATEGSTAGTATVSSSGTTDGWGSSFQRLTPAKRSTGGIPPSVLRAGRGRGRGGGRSASASTVPTVAANPATAADSAAAVAGAAFLTAGGQPLIEEYDPGRPNDYAKIREARDIARKEAEKEAERQEMKRAAERAAERVMAVAQAPMSTSPPRGEPGYSARDGSGDPSKGGGTPAAALTGEEAHARRAGLGRGGSGATGDDENRGMSLAAKMMEKMGWRGGGLGKEQQGMATPLIAQKKDNRSAVIVQGELDAHKRGTKIYGKPTKVVLLRNMVAPGQVDSTLEDEVGEECTSKYGTVVGVVIFEVTTPQFPAELAVRIFVAFERQESAIKAAIDLGGRFFGGRLVQATFYDEERFRLQDYAPGANED